MNNQGEKIKVFFEETVLEPKRSDVKRTPARNAVNAVAIVSNKTWEDVIKSLVEQAHIKGYLPTEKNCISDMLRANGLKPVKLEYGKNDSIKALVDTYYSEKKSFIVKRGSNNYYALMYDEKKDAYLLKGYKPMRIVDCMWGIDGLWEYIPESDHRTGIKRKSAISRNSGNIKDYFQKNMNPEGRNTGDCVIRALSAVYECTWYDAVDHIARATDYAEPMLNCIPSIIKTLIALGFERHNGIERNGQLLNGKQFCEYMTHTYSNGERIFAYVGKSHCAAILPFEENGRTVYKIQDTWDSTQKVIYEYWVYSKPQKTKTQTEAVIEEYTEGVEVSHPIFGKGAVISICGEGESRVLEVKFQSGICKKISESWFKKGNKK